MTSPRAIQRVAIDTRRRAQPRRRKIQSECSCDDGDLGLTGSWSELLEQAGLRKTTVVTGELRRVEMTRRTSHGRRGRLGLRFLHGGAPSTGLSEQSTFYHVLGISSRLGWQVLASNSLIYDHTHKEDVAETESGHDAPRFDSLSRNAKKVREGTTPRPTVRLGRSAF